MNVLKNQTKDKDAPSAGTVYLRKTLMDESLNISEESALVLNNKGTYSDKEYIRKLEALVKKFRAQYEEALRTEEQFSSLINNFPGVINVIDRDYRLVKTNVKHKAGEFSNLDSFRCFVTLKEKDRNCEDCLVPEVYRTGEAQSRDGNAEEREIFGQESKLFVAPVKNAAGEITGAIEILLDITELVETRNNLEEAKEKAEQSDRLKSLFLSNMSHEIRTPMNGIIGFSELLDNNNLSTEKRKLYTEIIRNSSRQLMNIIDDILDVSKIETGQAELYTNKFNLNQLLHQLFLFYQEKAKLKKTELEFAPALSDAEAVLNTDETKVKQIINNLLNNSVKFTEGGKIRFGYNFYNNKIHFFVEDTGIGIEEKYFDKIFERFMQIDSSTNKLYGGTGLGLSIAKSFAELLGGKISLKSEKGKGSVFVFSMPDTVLCTRSDNQFKEEKNKKKQKSILIAEDEEINFLLLEEYLHKTGCLVSRAKNGTEAVELCQNNTFDLILMDIKMPDMNGYEATKQIKKISPHIPIIAQTAYAMKGDKSEAIKAGCDDYLSKPIEQNQLLDLVGKYLKTG